MTVLLTGGAGYIGSHTAVELLSAGHDVIIADNYANSSPIVAQRITRITGKPVKCYEADAADPAALERIFQENAIDSVIQKPFIDVNERAVELTAMNAKALGVADRVSASAPDQVPADVRYDEIWSNPPIRIGKPALHELLDTWLNRLTEDGVAHLVVAHNLGSDSLAKWLTGQGWQVDRLGSAKGYRVFDVTRRH